MQNGLKTSDLELNDPRLLAIDAMKRSIPESIWTENRGFAEQLRKEIKSHHLFEHPALAALSSGSFSLSELQIIHLDYRHAIVQIFTDALTAAQVQSRQLEPRLPAGAKIPPRFLLTLNALDEFGFQPGLDSNAYYRGNPVFAHYPLFERLLEQLDVSFDKKDQYPPSIHADRLRHFLERSYSHYQSVLLLLAVAEEQVVMFSPALRQATHSLGIDVRQGYYHVHGTTSDASTSGADDKHEEDLWNALIQGCEVRDFENLRRIALEYLDLWNSFWEYHLNRAMDSKGGRL